MKKNFVLFGLLILGFVATLNANPLSISDQDYQAMMEKSLTSAGNNYRIKKVIEKLRKGDDVYIAAIGGSVTEGTGPDNYLDGYAYQFVNKVTGKYAANKDNVHFVNAGLQGTSSVIGLVRYQQDVVVSLGHTPDLLIIEFAVNDINEPTRQRAFEALIHDALVQNDDTAIIVLYSAALYPKTQSVMAPVADYYQVSQVSVSDAYDMAAENNVVNPKEFFKDVVHPLAPGHEIMADCLMYFLQQMDEASLDKKNALPEKPFKSPDFFNFQRILENNENVRIFMGGFNQVDPNTQGLLKSKEKAFPHNWYHSSKSLPKSLIFEVTCKNFILCYKEQGAWLQEKFGKVEIYVDGKRHLEKNSNLFDGANPKGWNNCVNLLLIDQAEAKPHTIEIKMTKGSEKKGFTVVCAGYSE